MIKNYLVAERGKLLIPCKATVHRHFLLMKQVVIQDVFRQKPIVLSDCDHHCVESAFDYFSSQLSWCERGLGKTYPFRFLLICGIKSRGRLLFAHNLILIVPMV